MSVPQMNGLLLTQILKPVIALTRIPELILADAVKDSKEGEKQHHNLSTKIDGVAGGIPRLIPLDICPS